MSSRKSLTATNLANYHHFNCDLFIHNIYHKKDPSGSKSRRARPSEFSRAQFKRGNEWESRLLSWLDENQQLLTISSAPLKADDFLESLQLDSDLFDRDHIFVAGLHFWPPNDELEK